MSNLKNKTVLILGWEFPPRMVGGLAIATYGIVEALSHFINIKLIIPFKDDHTPNIPNVKIYGLNQIDLEFKNKEIEVLLRKKKRFEKIESVFPYPLLEEVSSEHDSINRNEYTSKTTYKSYLEIFKSEELYGWSLWAKLEAYNELAIAIADLIDFDLIHCHDWVTFTAGKNIKTIYGKPLCLHVHALETDRVGTMVRNEIYDIERSAMLSADKIFPVSGYTKGQIVEHYNVFPDKITPIYNSIDPKKIERWKHQIPQRIVTFLGRITAQKGPQFLFETASKVIKKYPNVRFVIAGKGDQLMPLVSAAAREKISRYFIFPGFISRTEVDALLAASDVYFMPSVSEPFGLTAVEAARAGVPCVLTKQSGAAEVLKSALVADFWDTDLFASHIISLLKNEKLRQEKIASAKSEFQSMNWYSSASLVIEEYADLLN